MPSDFDAREGVVGVHARPGTTVIRIIDRLDERRSQIDEAQS